MITWEIINKSQNAFSRLMGKTIKQETGCWLYMGKPIVGKSGHRQFHVWSGPRPERKSYKMLAHRASWVFHNNKMIPDKMCVCHSCDTANCINPDHLWLGTQADNLKDMTNKNRRRGLKKPQIEAARTMLSSGNFYVKEVASILGIDRVSLHKIMKKNGIKLKRKVG